MIAGIAMVRDEADIIAPVLHHMLTQVDVVLVADNRSADRTRELIADLGERVTLIDDPEPGYYQAAKMTRLAREAAQRGASWVVPFDADEFWTSPDGHVGRTLEELPADVAVVSATMLNHVSTDADELSDDPTVRMRWRLREPGAMVKVACRPCVGVELAQGNHAASYQTAELPGPLFSIHHYPYRSVEQTIRKAHNGAAAYDAAPELPAWMGEHWRQHGRMSDEQLAGVFRDWWWFPNPAEDDRLVYDPVAAPTA